MNTFGTNFKITVFGESHGKQIGVVIDGCPSGISLTEKDFIVDLNRRKPKPNGGTARLENDEISILSGVFNGFTTGAAIAISIQNENTKPSDYNKNAFRPGHADFSANQKYNGYNDYRGGGIFSGRTTLSIVIAGVIAKKALKQSELNEINFNAHIASIGGIKNTKIDIISTEIEDKILKAKELGDSLGGIVECVISNIPVGIGKPYFDGIESLLSHLIFSIPGIKGIEFGKGFESTTMFGSEFNDVYIDNQGGTDTNHNGGINGGISNGNDIVFRVAVRPPASIAKPQMSYNFEHNCIEELKISGRHDTCFALRVPVIVEAVAAIAVLDMTI